MSQQLEYFTVYRVWYNVGTGLRDPHVPDQTQYHHAIFVRMYRDGSGYIHHARGDVTTRGGMTYETNRRDDVTRSQTFNTREILGYIPASSYPALQQVLRDCQTPPQQKAFNMKTMSNEPFKTIQPLAFYTADELKHFRFPRLKKCKWWVEDQALPAINKSRLLAQSPPPSSKASQPSSSRGSPASGSNGRSHATSGRGHSGSGQSQSSSAWVWDQSYRRYRYHNGREWVWQ